MLNLPQSIISALFAWLIQLFQPYSIIRSIFERNLQDNPSGIVGNFWLIPIVLLLGTDFIILRFYGLDFTSYWPLTFLYLAFVSLKLVFEAFVLFAVLRLMDVNVTPGMAFANFSLIVVYTPLFSWIGIPQAAHTYDLLSLLRSQRLNFADTITYLFAHAKEINEKLAYSAPLFVQDISVVGAVVYLISATLLAESISQMLNVGRPKAYVVTAIANTLNYIPAVLVGLFQIAAVYASLNPQSP